MLRLFIALFIMTSAFELSAQEKEIIQKKSIQEILSSKQFIFQANTAHPLRMNVRYLTPPNDLLINKDTLISNLPYFGVAHIVPPKGEPGISFTTTEFTYQLKKGRKNQWELKIETKGQASASGIEMIIYEDGSALATVTSNFRDRIQFRGSVRPLESRL